MPQHTRPASLDSLDLPAEVSEYISGLEENSGVEKSDIYKGLTPEAAEIVRKSAEVIEKSEQEHWLSVAKKFDAIPGDKEDLAKSLRTLHDTNKPAYDSLVASLEGANEAAKRGAITKSYGLPGAGEPQSDIEKRQAKAKDLVEKGLYPTIEQATVALLNENPSEYDQKNR